MRALLFGLGEEGCSAEGQSRVAMDVRWPDGRVDRFDPGSFPLGRYLVVEYGKGVVPSR
jgi:hypothetical protein